MNKKILFSGLVVLIVLAGGIYYWMWSTKKGTQKYENVSVESTPQTKTESQDTVSDTPTPQADTPPSPLPTPPKNVMLDSSSQSTPPSESPSKDISISSHLVSYGHSTGSDSRKIDTIVVHSSYNNLGGDEFSSEGIWKEWQDANVAPHYYIDRDGKIYLFVRESDIAWHAGVAKVPDGRTNVNDFSIGIELDGTKTSGYTAKQYASLNQLIADIKSRHRIKYILGHDDIAPGRKTDPWAFDWSKVKK